MLWVRVAGPVVREPAVFRHVFPSSSCLFLLIRPQQKRTKQHREMVNSLRAGDRVVTGGGIHGRVTAVSDTVLTVEIADKVRVKVNRANVSGVVPASAPAQPAKKNKADSEKSK